MKLADGLFRNTFKKVAEDYPTLETNDMIVDNASMQCVSRPQQFDVMVMPNLYGSVLSNIGAGLVGGPGIVPGCNMGRDVAVFEPGCRHVGLDIKGKDQANPTALILSAAMMLRHVGLDDHANRISKAVYETIGEGYASPFSDRSSSLIVKQQNQDTGYGWHRDNARVHQGHFG
jgi:isocitrate dehydrogenase (NAD+)